MGRVQGASEPVPALPVMTFRVSKEVNPPTLVTSNVTNSLEQCPVDRGVAVHLCRASLTSRHPLRNPSIEMVTLVSLYDSVSETFWKQNKVFLTSSVLLGS